MRSGIVMSFATLVLGIISCGAEDGGDDGQAATTLSMTTVAMSSTTADASESGSEDEGSSGGGATTMPATTGMGETGAAESGATAASEDSGGSMTAGESTSTGEMFDPCAPADADDDCNACTKANCCAQLQTCFDDPICECMAGCVMGAGDIQPCTQMCGQTGNFTPVTDCAASMCLFECIG